MLALARRAGRGLEGVKSKRGGIGARLAARAGGERRIFEVMGSDSYLSGNDLRVHVGMVDLKQDDLMGNPMAQRQVDRIQGGGQSLLYSRVTPTYGLMSEERSKADQTLRFTLCKQGLTSYSAAF